MGFCYTAYMNEPLHELPKEIGNPATSALLNIHVRSLAQVREMSDKELLALHGVGPKAVRILREHIALMRTIKRDIVGGFFFSKDNRVLLGKNRKGGVYEGSYVVPGGGIEDEETHDQALRREMMEEAGLDISKGQIDQINIATGEHEKTLPGSGERVLVKMTFYDYRIVLPDNAEDIHVTAEDDWAEPRWFTAKELASQPVGDPTRRTLQKIGFLA
jgi:8-oxo-dGTP pyrophosphatase MutT (NUDIX family)